MRRRQQPRNRVKKQQLRGRSVPKSRNSKKSKGKVVRLFKKRANRKAPVQRKKRAIRKATGRLKRRSRHRVPVKRKNRSRTVQTSPRDLTAEYQRAFQNSYEKGFDDGYLRGLEMGVAI